MEVVYKLINDIKAGFLKVLEQNSLGAYFGALGVLALALLLLFFGKKIVGKILARPFIAHNLRINQKYAHRVYHRLFSFCYVVPFYWALGVLKMPDDLNKIITITFSCLFLFTGVRFVSALVALLIDFALRGNQGRYAGQPRLDPATGKAVMPIANILLWAIAITFFLDNLGFKVSTIIAGLGIMGVAVGLAGQAILGDFFSYLVILIDKPFKIGDVVTLNAGGVTGTIERIGLKTTRLRSLTGEKIICSNGELTRGLLTNFDDIRSRRVRLLFPLPFNLPPAKIATITEAMREIISANSDCTFVRAVLLDFGPWSMNFELLYKVNIGDATQALAVQHEVNLKILSYLEEQNIALAVNPTTTGAVA